MGEGDRSFPISGSGLVAALIIISTLAGSVFFLQKNIRRSYTPVEGVPTLLFANEPEKVRKNSDFDLILKINPNTAAFYAFELYVKYDPAEVGFQNTGNPSANIVSSYPLIISSINEVSQTISVVGTRLGSSFTGREEVEISRDRMRRSGSSGKAEFIWGDGTKLGDDIQIQTISGQI